MQSHADSRQLPGASIAITRGADLVYTHCCGQRSVETGAPFELDTVVRIFSMTKPITSVALMTLVERGLIHLDAPVSDVLPEFSNMQALISGAHHIDQTEPCPAPTLHQLLTHTAGMSYPFNAGPLPRAMEDAQLLFKPDQGRLADMVTTLSALPLAFQPGTRWEYSVATDVLGRVVEVVIGKTLGEVFQEDIFGPLGMGQTGFAISPAGQSKLASLYTPLEGDIFAFNTGVLGQNPLRLVEDANNTAYASPQMQSGGGGLLSTLHDYLRFADMLRNGGTGGGHRILSPGTVAFMMQNHLSGDIASMGPSSFAEQPMEGMGFGLGGAVVLDPARARCIGSVGDFSWGGMASTFFWVDPTLRLSVVFMTQLAPSNSYPLRSQIKSLVHSALG
ncbi:MAG: serine hydrolase domain-containing protein [Pseudomonadota bacterium]